MPIDEPRIERTNFDGDWSEPCPYCGEAQEIHRTEIGEYDGVRYEHRVPCAPEQKAITRRWRYRARSVKTLVLVWWVLIPLFVAIVGFADPMVGLLLFAISICKIAVSLVRLFGKPGKWLPGYDERQARQRRMEHYFYHCEMNPEGFARVLVENLENECVP